MKVVINTCFGGFGLSKKAEDYLIEHYDFEEIYAHKIERNHEGLVEVVEKLGTQANGRFSDLKIVEIPDNIDWEITEYDGMENVQEKTRRWS